MSYSDWIKRPFQDAKLLAVGAIISAIPIINLISIGYFIECARRSFKNDNTLPDWADVAGKLLTGLKVSIIQAIYAIPVLIASLILLYSLFGPIFTKVLSGDLAGVQIALSNMVTGFAQNLGSYGLGIFVVVILAFILGLMSLAGVLKFAQTNSFGSAFSFGDVKSVAFTLKFLISLIISGLIGGVMGALLGVPVSIVVGILPNIAVPYLGNLFQLIGGGFLSFTTGIIYWTILANKYTEDFLAAAAPKTDGGRRKRK